MEELITLIITGSGAILNARYDSKEIKGERYILNHNSRAVIRFAAILAMIYFIIPTYSWVQVFLALLVLGSFFWIVFDISINLYLGKYYLRIGKTSVVDKLMQNLGEYYAFALKLSVFIGSCILYLMHYDTLFY